MFHSVQLRVVENKLKDYCGTSYLLSDQKRHRTKCDYGTGAQQVRLACPSFVSHWAKPCLKTEI